MQILRGNGKLFDGRGNCLGEIKYDIHRNGSTGEEWWGEITPQEGIMPQGDCIIELDNGLRGAGTIRMRTNSSFGLVVDSFDIKGNGPLK